MASTTTTASKGTSNARGKALLATSTTLALAAGTAAAWMRTEEEAVAETRAAAPNAASTVNFIADAVEQAWPSLVHVSSLHTTFFGQIGSGGSGFVIHPDGFIATNAHVVAHAEGAKLTVTFTDGSEVEASVWAMDSHTDLALIKVERLPPNSFPAKLGASASLRPGEFVAALGSPMRLHNTVTSGVVSSTARHANELGLPSRIYDFIQIDAAINSGNSGGPLINMSGEVVGINTMKAAGPEGISFAIPNDVAGPVLEQLRLHRRVRRPYLGLRMVTVDPHVAAFERRRPNSDFPSDTTEGVLIVQVAPGSPSEKAGMQPGDVIVAVDGQKVKETGDVLRALGYDTGKRLAMDVVRGGAKRQLDVTTEVMP